MRLRKGYVFIVLFSLFVAISQSLKYRLFTKRDLSAETLHNLIIQAVSLFVVIVTVGIVAVRWYYRMKDK